jgi:hypothetical protein
MAPVSLESEKKNFFFKKRSKKLLSVWLRLFRTGSDQMNKGFLVLFFKKELLAFASPICIAIAYAGGDPNFRQPCAARQE